MINPAFDGVVWAAAFAFLALMGARAWAVETSQTRLSRPGARVRGLTTATVAMLAVLVGLLTYQGGAQFVSAVITAKTGAGPPAVQQAPAPAAPAKPAPAAPAPAAPARN